MAQFSMSSLDTLAGAALRLALNTARDLNHREITVWHMMNALGAQDPALNSQLPPSETPTPLSDLIALGLDQNKFVDEIETRIGALSSARSGLSSPPADQVLGDILNALVERLGGRVANTRDVWAQLLLSSDLSGFFETCGISASQKPKLLQKMGLSAQEADQSFLSRFCRDLTEAAREGSLDPVVGRDDEIRETMNILQRRTKNNPVLVGEPGVGKTAMVEGLAQRMIKNEVPETLKGKRLMSLDLGAIVAGAKFKGELEERVKGLVKEIQDSSDVVLFIDEIHTLVNSSGEAGAVGQLLKPALARGELRCIGATTQDEYRQYFEKDPALERRFQKITVLEPSLEDAVAILRGLQDQYARHHGVEITDSALVAAVELSARYMTDRQLPDKAIDLMDAAAARVRTVLDSKPEAIDRLDRKMIQLKVQRETIKKEEMTKGDLDEDTQARLTKLEQEIQSVEKQATQLEERWVLEKELHDKVLVIQEQMAEQRQELEKAQREQDLAKISEIQYGSLPTLEKSLRLAKKQARSHPEPLMHDQVTADQIAEVVARRTGIPVAKMQGGEQEKLADMENLLGKKVIGQPDAVESVSDAVRRSRSGLSDPGKPIGSFLFLGPTGVGKTELTKVLSSFLFDRKDAMVRIDMSEFMEKHSVSRLIGAPPGYVGYEEGGMLTEAIRQSPYSVILLDEVEKAHPDVFNILLQVLDDGHLTDGQGRTVDFKNTVIIMTSNLGSGEIQDLTAAGSSQDDIKKAVMEHVKDYFRPEFINRLDETVIFKPLDQPAIRQIADLKINSLVKKLGVNRKIDMVISKAAIDHLAVAGFDPLMGARPLNRAIQQELENPLAKDIVAGKIKSGDRLEIDAVGGQLKWVATTPTPEEEEVDAVASAPDAEYVVSTPSGGISAQTITTHREAGKKSKGKPKTAVG